LQLAVHFNFS